MTIHNLTTPGGRKTVCGLNVPGILLVDRTATTWEDGDVEIGQGGKCADGCWKAVTTDGYDLMMAEKPEPRPSALQRFRVMANKPRGEGQHQIGRAITNRDHSVNVYLDSIPLDGKVFLIPEGG